MNPITVYLTDGGSVTATGRLELPDTGAVVVSGPEGVVLAVARGTWRMVTSDDAQVTWAPTVPAPKWQPPITGVPFA